jgi:hypothetical protein
MLLIEIRSNIYNNKLLLTIILFYFVSNTLFNLIINIRGYMVHLGRWITFPKKLDVNNKIQIIIDLPNQNCNINYNNKPWNNRVIDIPNKIKIFVLIYYLLIN